MPITVVIPALDEAGNIGRLVQETLGAVPPDLLGEIIVIDDASSDGTSEEVKAIAAQDTRVRCLSHASRSGQSAAVRTGVQAARYPVIATMDGDGQNDPHDLPAMFARLAVPGTDGPAFVGGVRSNRRATGSKRFASRSANWIRDRVLRDDCPDSGCGIKLFWREGFQRLPFFTSMHRFMPALFQIYGYTTDYVPVNDRPRMAGKSKYNNLGRALIALYDLFGIVWLRKRTVVPMVVQDSETGQHVSAQATGGDGSGPREAPTGDAAGGAPRRGS